MRIFGFWFVVFEAIYNVVYMSSELINSFVFVMLLLLLWLSPGVIAWLSMMMLGLPAFVCILFL